MKKIVLPIMLLLLISNCYGDDVDMSAYFKKKANEYFSEAVRLRRHLHQYPELCFQEKATSNFIFQYLKKLGLTVETGIAGTGIKAILRGYREQPVLAIRSDMDALPIQEKTGFSFSSRNNGIMHACGHDAHMTNVLITAKILSEIREKIPGTVVFIFQPCEEGPPADQAGGAQKMIQENVLKNPTVNAIIGLHVFPGIPVGSIGIRPGAMMANVASFYITIFGKSSHGAFPHQGIDAIYVASSAIQQFQSLISRFKDPGEMAVLSVGKIKGGVRVNVIAEKVEMEGTVRSFSFEVQDQIALGMEKILKGLSLAFGTTYLFNFCKDAPYVKNDENLTRFIDPVFKKILGDDRVLEIKPLTIAEDFSYYSHQIPSVFFLLGTGDQSPLHTPTFSVNEDIFKIGPVLLSSAAINYLNRFPLTR
jgi:amidohydrolase